MSIPVRSCDRAGQRLAPPRGREVDLALVADLVGHVGDQLLAALGGRPVVGIGLVPLEHRELGVVLVGHALVAEVLAQLVDALEPADDQALEVELGRDAQVQRAVELVVVRRERPRQRAAVDRLEHGRLDLDKAPLVEPAAHRADDLRPQDEQLARLLVGHQVELAVAVAQLDVGEAVVLLGRWAQRLREHAEVLHAQRQLAAAGAQHAALCADQIAEVEAEQALERLLAEVVDARHQLDAPGAIDDVEERRLALLAPRRQAAGDAPALLGLGTGFESFERRLDLGDRRDVRVGVRERVDAVGAQRFELAPPCCQELAFPPSVGGHGVRLRRSS